jgi:hypothetical protein
VTDKFTISLPTFDECLSVNGRHEVNGSSTLGIRKALEQFARYFKAEFHYDDVQYYADEHDEDCRGFLFTEPALDIVTEEHPEMPTRCLGGCCFRYVRFSDGDRWVLYWVWFHPFFRGRGLLSKHWGKFSEHFGDFIVAPPMSSAMKSFVAKQDIKRESPGRVNAAQFFDAVKREL